MRITSSNNRREKAKIEQNKMSLQIILIFDENNPYRQSEILQVVRVHTLFFPHYQHCVTRLFLVTKVSIIRIRQ
jgi:hypothetical protein